MDKLSRRCHREQQISICFVSFYPVITEIWHFRPILALRNEDFRAWTQNNAINWCENNIVFYLLVQVNSYAVFVPV